MTTTHFQIAEISPTPDEEIVAAITMALDAAWPEAVSPLQRPHAPNAAWRFGDRRWRERQIPRQTWGSRT